MSLSYPTDLTDAQWELIQSLLSQAKPGDRPRSTDLCSVVNALLWFLKIWVWMAIKKSRVVDTFCWMLEQVLRPEDLSRDYGR